MAFDPQNIIGKTVDAYISRPGPGKTRIYMMMFTDGSCCEFVSGKKNAFSHRHIAATRGSTNESESSPEAILSSQQQHVQQMALNGF